MNSENMKNLYGFEMNNPVPRTADFDELLDIMANLPAGRFMDATLTEEDVAAKECRHFLYEDNLESFSLSMHRILKVIVYAPSDLRDQASVREDVKKQIVDLHKTFAENRILLLVNPEPAAVQITVLEVAQLPLHLRPRTTEALAEDTDSEQQKATLDGVLDLLCDLPVNTILNVTLAEEGSANVGLGFHSLYENEVLTAGYWGSDATILINITQEELQEGHDFRKDAKSALHELFAFVGGVGDDYGIWILPEQYTVEISYQDKEESGDEQH